MLVFVLNVVTIIKTLLYYVLYSSYKTGYFIITTVREIWNIIHIFATNSAVLLRIIAEDFLIFLTDVMYGFLSFYNGLYWLIDSIFQSVLSVLNVIKTITNCVVWIATATLDSFSNGILKIYLGIGQLIANIKYFLVLLGSGVWFAVTLVPLFVVYMFTMTTYYTGRLFEEIFNMFGLGYMQCLMFVKETYEFITDVPFESLAGLIAGICISYIIVKFHLILYRMLNGYMHSIADFLLSAMNRFLNYFRKYLRRFRNVNSEESTEHESASKRFENHCVICQEREKCILMLPCKHVCLCVECSYILRRYHHSCPICRTVVQKTMKIYV